MAIDPTSIELTPKQKALLAEIAERTGKDYAAIVDELLASFTKPRPTTTKNGAHGVVPRTPTAYEAFVAVGAIGCFEGPPDLSTNQKYMDGFGVNAGRKSAD